MSNRAKKGKKELRGWFPDEKNGLGCSRAKIRHHR